MIYPYIFYLVMLDNVDEKHFSPFMGISQSMIQATGAIDMVCRLPLSIFDPISDQQQIIARRISGASYRFVAMRLPDLDGLVVQWDRPLWVVISPTEVTAHAVEKWRSAQYYRALHVSPVAIGNIVKPEDVNIDLLREHFLAVLTEIQKCEPLAAKDAADCLEVIRRWKAQERTPVGHTWLGHNVTHKVPDSSSSPTSNSRPKRIRPTLTR